MLPPDDAFAHPDDLLARGASPALQALLSEETGVRYDALALFAEPLFGLYDLDFAEVFAAKAAPESAMPEVAALMESARVLWAFFSLPPAERARKRPALAAHLVGHNPTEEEWVDLDGLLDTLEPYWQAMLPEEIAEAEQTDAPVLDFDALLAHPAFSLGAEHPAGYGANGISEMEARALFAQPLLETPGTLADATAFEHAMERASAYWYLAQAPETEREARLRETVAALSNGLGPEAVEAEARQMIARYERLFAER